MSPQRLFCAQIVQGGGVWPPVQLLSLLAINGRQPERMTSALSKEYVKV